MDVVPDNFAKKGQSLQRIIRSLKISNSILRAEVARLERVLAAEAKRRPIHHKRESKKNDHTDGA